MKYERLTTDEQRQILESRVRQFEAEHYNHAVNVELEVASGRKDKDTQDRISFGKDAMAQLEKARDTLLVTLSKKDK